MWRLYYKAKFLKNHVFDSLSFINGDSIKRTKKQNNVSDSVDFINGPYNKIKKKKSCCCFGKFYSWRFYYKAKK
jgi:hypothetical protein